MAKSFEQCRHLERVALSETDGDQLCRIKRSPSIQAQRVHEVIAEAFGCERQQVKRVLFGDRDVLEGESFEDHGIEWRYSL